MVSVELVGLAAAAAAARLQVLNCKRLFLTPAALAIGRWLVLACFGALQANNKFSAPQGSPRSRSARRCVPKTNRVARPASAAIPVAAC